MNPEYMTPKLARMIFTKEPELFFDIPERFKDRDMCEAAVRYDGAHLRMVLKNSKRRSFAGRPYATAPTLSAIFRRA